MLNELVKVSGVAKGGRGGGLPVPSPRVTVWEG